MACVLLESTDPNYELLFAVSMNDLEGAERALSEGADVNAVTDCHEMPLHISASRCYFRMTDLLLSEPNVLVNSKTVFGHTPLYMASIGNNFQLFSMLLEKGADPNIRLHFDKTVIHRCAFKGKYSFTEELIKYGADVNAKDCFSRSPLYMNFESLMSLDMTKLLVQAGANVNETFINGTPIIHSVVESHHTDKLKNIIYLLDKGADINATDLKEENMLHKAARMGNSVLIKMIVEKYKGDLTATNLLQQTPLTIARLYNNRGTVRVITKLLQEIENVQEEIFYRKLLAENKIRPPF